MSSQIFQPCEELKEYVSHFWAGKWNSVSNGNSTYFSTANIQTELAFAFQSSPGKRYSELLFSSVLGHTEKHNQFPMNGDIELFGVSLYAHAVPCLFNVSTSELTDQIISFDTLLGKQGRIINEKMANAFTTQKRLEILSGYFKEQLAKERFEDKIITRAIKQIRRDQGIVNVNKLAAESYLSQKQFERRFAAFSGFNPKLYARIIRFETALWDRKNYHTLTEVAHAYGYYDQAHFIRDFKTFSGFSPNKFFSLTGY
jgi:AraC-like DNA-binding protein